jgi:hypothetical protein
MMEIRSIAKMVLRKSSLNSTAILASLFMGGSREP